MVAMVSPKSQVRTHIRSARRAMPPHARAAADSALIRALLDLVRAVEATAVAAYAPLPSEPGGVELVPALAAVVPDLLLPVLRDDLDLDWAPCTGEPLVTGRFGLAEPSGPRLGRDAVTQVDLVVVPALAIDRAGVRLGQGGGSYDRVLTRVAKPTIALLYPGELRESVPAEPHDQRVTGVLVGYEPAHLYWTKPVPMTQHWHSNNLSANDGG